jgi:hypothetical protein
MGIVIGLGVLFWMLALVVVAQPVKAAKLAEGTAGVGGQGGLSYPADLGCSPASEIPDSRFKIPRVVPQKSLGPPISRKARKRAARAFAAFGRR